MSFIVDCHAHIYGSSFTSDIKNILSESYEKGVRAIINVSESIENAIEIKLLCQSFPQLKFSCGLHPVTCLTPKHSILEDVNEILAFAKENQEHLICIGECGLDFSPHVTKTQKDKDDQRFVFDKQIQFAKEFNLPLNVHSRSAGKPTIDFLKEKGAENVLLHSFDGNEKAIKAGLECGYYFSVPASIGRQENMKKLVNIVPLDRILLETDSPALHPIKGPNLRNVPSNLQLSCQGIADIKKISYEEVAKNTTNNAKRLFTKLELIS